MDKEKVDLQVAIIGGGIAGLAAASALLPSSLSWAIFQASDHLGGRIDSIMIDDRRVDTGAYELASYSQKRQKQNSLYQLIKSGFSELDFRTQLNRIVYRNEKGFQYTEKTIQKVSEKIQKLAKLVNQWTKHQHNLSVQQCIDRFKKEKYLQDLSQSQEELFDLMILMQEQQQGGDADDIAADSFFADGDMQQDQIDSYPLPTITYHGLIEKIGQKLTSNNKGTKIYLNTKIKRIRFQQSQIEIISEDKVWRVQRVICCLPLSSIQKKEVVFQPEIPANHQFILDNLAFGSMQKVILSFEQRFWGEDMQRIKIASKSKGKFPHFSNISGPKAHQDSNSHILCCYLTGSYSISLLSKFEDKQIIEMAVDYLKGAFPKEKIVLREGYVTRWISKDHIKGSFSYMRPNLRFERAKQIRQPINQRFWFAGEYCYPQNIGCAHGAYETGWRAACQILQMEQKNKRKST